MTSMTHTVCIIVRVILYEAGISENSNHGVIGVMIVLYSHFIGISKQMTVQIRFKLLLSFNDLSIRGDLL